MALSKLIPFPIQKLMPDKQYPLPLSLILSAASFLCIFFLVRDFFANTTLHYTIQQRNEVLFPPNYQNFDTSPRYEGERLTPDFAVYIEDDLDIFSLAESLDMMHIGQVGVLSNHHIFRAHAARVEEANKVLEDHPRIIWFAQQTLRWRHPRTSEYLANLSPHKFSYRGGASYNTTHLFIPADPRFNEQWHLHNTGQRGGTKGEDMRVLGAWDLSTGQGVCVAIVDDGLMYSHPDLQQRYSAKNSHNFNAAGAPTDPMPLPGDSHGTMCAGATAATTNNVCGVGVAFRASVSGLRILGGPSSDAMEAQALTYMYNDNHIYSSSWGPTDNGLTLEGPGPLTKAALADGVTRGRDGKGSIYIWAAGNGAPFGDNCNYDGYASSRYVLTVGAVNHFGRHAYYSEPCAAIIVSAPSSGQNLVGITTTDMNDGCTNDFTGTSASAPLVAGVAALMLEVNNNLTWRDVHHILVCTARHNDPEDSDWTTNGAGFYINHKYGFGVVDAHAAVVAAQNWSSVGKEISFISPVIDVYTLIADNSHQATVSTYNVETDMYLEHVEIVFTSFHPYRSDLRVVLTSPSNTKSVLSTLHGTSSSYEFKLIHPKNITKIFQIVLRASFGPSPAEWDQQNATAQIVVANPSDGCSLFQNQLNLTGLLVVVQRGGSCEYTTKVKNAQNRGAAAVIVVLGSENDVPTDMSGMDSSIVIPAVMLSGKDSRLLMSQLSSPAPVVGMLLARVHKQGGLIPFNEWTFSTVRNWNESSVGTWTLSVSDLSPGGVGTFDRWQLKLHGTQGSSTPISPPPHKPLHHHHITWTRIALFTFIIFSVPLLGVAVGWWVLKSRTKLDHSTEVLLEEISMQDEQ